MLLLINQKISKHNIVNDKSNYFKQFSYKNTCKRFETNKFLVNVLYFLLYTQ